ncbi:MAG: ammonium transporter [Magnetococcales bacterium]|nr:ammonium transporter [Magnetococcales bacterium]
MLLFPFSALASEEAVMNGADTAWILTSIALVLFMTLPGLSLFYGGLARSKNVLSVLMHCFAIACLISILWLVYGYGMAFGDGGAFNSIIGGGKYFLAGIGTESLSGSIPEGVFSMFQLTFAIITPALIAGAWVERIRFSAVLLFSGLWFTLVYLPLCHWVWGGGWMAEQGVMDFAGGIVVHISAGVASLVIALVLGPRRGFPTSLMPPHNMTMAFSGAAMLWVGWFGFNGGSALAAGGGAGFAIMATHMAAAAGSLGWMTIEWIRHGKPSVLGIITGMVAGLGTVTPASGFISPLGGAVIGLIAGITCYWAVIIIKQKLKIDDSLDVFPVHGVGGILGTLLTAIFASPAMGGLGYASEGMNMVSQLGVQFLGVAGAVIWTAMMTWIILRAIGMVSELRVSENDETEGLDVTCHNERGYIMENSQY